MFYAYFCIPMEDKKQFILKSVCQLYQKHGIKSITMDDIAGEFGISKKTLYQYFNDKEDLVVQVFDYLMENPMFNLNDESFGNAIDRLLTLRNHVLGILKHLNTTFEYDLKKYYPELHRKWNEFRTLKIYKDTYNNLTEGISEGLFREDIDPDFIARLQVGRMLYIFNIEYKIFTEQQLTTIDLFDKLMDYHLHAVCTEKGIEYYRKVFGKNL